ncbi:MAG: two-component regulator propeller domain-containing protein [Planctomycetota bacterium]
MDRQGRLLIAAYDDIIRYDGRSFVPLNKGEGLESWYAFDVLEDRHGDIWIASDQSGVFRVDGDTGAVSRFTTDDGIGNRRNMCVYEDRAGNIWIGGQGGLTRFDGTTFRNFTVADGLGRTTTSIPCSRIATGNLGSEPGAMRESTTESGLPRAGGTARTSPSSTFGRSSKTVPARHLADRPGVASGGSTGRLHHETADVWKVYEDAEGALVHRHARGAPLV